MSAVSTDMSQQVNNYIHRKKSIPPFPGPNGWRSDPEDDLDPQSVLSALVLDLAALRVDADNLASSSEPRMAISRMLRRANVMETALDTWYNSYPEQWEPLEPSSGNDVLAVGFEPWKPPVPHHYPNLSVAYALNTYRNYRIHIHQVQVQCYTALDRTTALKQFARQLDRSLRILHQLCDDICASVPYHLENKDIPHNLGAGFILPPLIAASSVDELPIQQTTYINDQLHKLAFPDHDMTGPWLILDVRISARMAKFKSLPPPNRVARVESRVEQASGSDQEK